MLVFACFFAEDAIRTGWEKRKDASGIPGKFVFENEAAGLHTLASPRLFLYIEAKRAWQEERWPDCMVQPAAHRQLLRTHKFV